MLFRRTHDYRICSVRTVSLTMCDVTIPLVTSLCRQVGNKGWTDETLPSQQPIQQAAMGSSWGLFYLLTGRFTRLYYLSCMGLLLQALPNEHENYCCSRQSQDT